MKKSLQEYCKENSMEYLLNQWNQDKNGDISPSSVSYGSKKKVWWRCKNGHEWQAKVYRRLAGNGCPVCSNRMLAPGINDFGTMYPEVAKQWHPTKNETLTPRDVFAGSRKKVWWSCEHGHEWQASIYSRCRGHGCPVCTGRMTVPGVNDLASAVPDIVFEWHPTKNGALKPEMVTVSSNRKVWWKCERGHEWEAIVSTRTLRRSSCPYCAGRMVWPGFNDLGYRFPDIAAQWHPVLNGELTPNKVTAGSSKSVWWKCDLGHTWKAIIYSRTAPKNPTGCPVCAGKGREHYQDRYSEALKEK